MAIYEGGFEMKKRIAMLLSTFIALMVSTNIYASTSISIEKAEQTSTGVITVECSIDNPNSSQSITVLSCEQKDEISSDDIIYIDQFTANLSSENKFTFDFLPATWTDTDKVYIVKVGGYGVDTPDSMIIAFYEGIIYKAGDINGDGEINKNDASLLLKYLSGISDLTNSQITAGDMNKDAKVDINDVIEILKK